MPTRKTSTKRRSTGAKKKTAASARNGKGKGKTAPRKPSPASRQFSARKPNEPRPPDVPKVPIGRPRKITPDTIKLVAQSILAGNFIETSLAYAGLSRETGYDAMRRGRAEVARVEALLAKEFETTKVEPTDDDFNRLLDPRERVFVEFIYTIQACLAKAEHDAAAALYNYTRNPTNDSQARALQWRLSRRFSKRWHKSETGVSVDVDLEVETNQEVSQEGVRYTEVAVVTRHGARIAVDGIDLEARDFDDEFGGDEPEAHEVAPHGTHAQLM